MTHAHSNVIVGYDGTFASQAAVDRAAAETRAREATLHIVTCYETRANGSPMSDRSFELARQLVDAVRVRVASARPHHAISTTVSRGPAYSELIAVARHGDLIVIGASSDRHTGLSYDSTAARLLRHSTCPVLVVPASSVRRPARVVAGIDGSEDGDLAMLCAAAEAERFAADLTVVHAWGGGLAVRGDAIRLREDARLEAVVTLESAVERIGDRRGIKIVPMLIEQLPVDALLSVVTEDDLLVVAPRGRGALKSTLFGSTLKGILERSPTAVLVARSAGQ